MTVDDWLNVVQDDDGRDDLLECIAFLARRFDKPSSREMISAGLALDDRGKLPFHQAEAALDQIGLVGETVHRRLSRWRQAQLPAILRLQDGRAAVLVDIRGDDVSLFLPGRAEPAWSPRTSLDDAFAGEAIAVFPDNNRERESERPWDEQVRRHWFWQEVWKVRKSFGFVILAATFINLLAFALPLFTMNVYDRIIPNKAAASLWVLAFGVMLAFALDFGLRLARARLVDETGRGLDARLSQKLFEKVMNMPLADRAGSTGALARRVSEFEQVREFFASTTVVLIVDMAFLLLFLGLIALLGGALALIPLVTMIVMASAGFVLQKSMGKLALAAQADSSLQATVLFESIGGMETLKACRAEGRMLGRWRRYAEMSATTQEKTRRLTATSINLAALCQQVTSISLIIGGFYLFNSGAITMGAIIAIVMLAGRSLAPVGQLAYLITRARQSLTTLNSLQTLMDGGDERQLGSRGIAPEIRRGAITMENLEFSYPNTNRPSLRDVNLKIEPGERIGIIGRVASGKSTLGRLICGLYQPTEGAMLIDDLDSRQYHPHAIRAEFRFVGQDAELFSGTIRENLIIGAQSNDDQKLIDALHRSGADRFFARDAAGFDLHVGERGSRLSGGQRSFLVLARAMVEPHKLLYLDEPTGAMDNQTEALFIESLNKGLEPGQTLIVSTHRMQMLTIVDRLLVIDQGVIIADGPRDAILSQMAGRVEQ